MQKTYYGITIGPIFDTILLSAKPLGLWYASFIFSEFSREICYELKQKQDTELYVPHADSYEGKLAVGKFHDRIIFQSSLTYEEVKALVEGVIERMDNQPDLVELKGYFNYHIASLSPEKVSESQNVIAAFSSVLDSMELHVPSVSGDRISKMRGLLSDNNQLKELERVSHYEQSLIDNLGLVKKDQNRKLEIRDVESICASKKSKGKSNKYYALIQADGDSVGKELMKLKSDQEIRVFSKALLAYTEKVRALFEEYGATLIYAGGDDLLGMLPIYHDDSNHIFSLCKKINTAFKETMAEVKEQNSEFNTDNLSISFGVAIFYYKYPLYEAFKQSAYQLFEVAKGVKNCVAVYCKKHSGQEISFLIKNDWKVYDRLLTRVSKDKKNNSYLYHLIQSEDLIKFALEKDLEGDKHIIETFFKNYFDHVTQQTDVLKGHIDLVKDLIEDFKPKEGDEEENQLTVDDIFSQLVHIARFRKFLTEEMITGEEKVDDNV